VGWGGGVSSASLCARKHHSKIVRGRAMAEAEKSLAAYLGDPG
jgi:hypothetical protein